MEVEADEVTPLPPDEGNPVVGGFMGQQAHNPGNPVGQKRKINFK